MDFTIEEDQIALQDAVRRFCVRTMGPASLQVTKPAEQGVDSWPAMAELGLMGLTFGEDVGGAAQTAVETALVVDELARYLLAGRYIEISVLCGTLLDRVAQPAQRSDLLAPLVAGASQPALALDDAWQDGMPCMTSARFAAGRWLLEGAKTGVMQAERTDVLLVVATLEEAGSSGEASSSPALFAVPVDAPGVCRSPIAALDGHRAACIRLDGVSLEPAARVDREGTLEYGLSAAINAAQAALCAERAGILAALLQATIEHLKTRQQFGRPLADFQALQHQLADLYIRVEQCRSMAQLAAMAVDDAGGRPGARGDGREAAAVPAKARALAAAAAYTQEAALTIGERVIQLHGAMGMTDECAVGHFMRRLLVSEARFGSASEQFRRFGAFEEAGILS